MADLFTLTADEVRKRCDEAWLTKIYNHIIENVENTPYDNYVLFVHLPEKYRAQLERNGFTVVEERDGTWKVSW